jgi:hypothetical protein
MSDKARKLITELVFEGQDGKIKATEKNVKQLKKGLRRTAKTADRLKRNMNQAFAVMKAGFAAVIANLAFQLFTGDVARNVDQLDKWAQSIGVTMDQMQGLDYVAQRMSAETEELHDVMHTFTERVNDAFGPDASKDAQGMLKQLGLTKAHVTDTNGALRDSNELLLVMADAFQGVENKAQRAALLDTVLGDAGRRVARVILQGREGIETLAREARERGMVLDKETIATTKEYTKAKVNLTLVLKSFRNMIATKIIPSVTGALKGFNRWARSSENLQRAFEVLKAVAGAVAGVLAFNGLNVGISMAGKMLANVRELAQGLRAMGWAAIWAQA